ncbi:MAG: 50S ribosomal protein L23 [Patescibacteria group bacterium]|nr:50S ribosomal protein L23 [Patescibacteria group bacterium]MCX7589901.1 50S ribosomal protein L23 [Patescibacteria group bacterium]MDW8279581.1 50S ribosomal protein L23 [bacterium]
MKVVNLIKKPHITEKGTFLKDQNKYVFDVSKNANKSEIKKEIKNIYGVDVVKINIINIPAKSKNFRNIVSKKKTFYKKAIVTLKDGQKIDLI